MFKDQKLKVLLVLFLVFCVSSSKGIIIYNEETLVAISFISFVIFSFHYFGSTIQDSLDERSLTIKTEYQNFLSLKQESLQQLAKEHKRISQLKPLLNKLGGFTHSYLSQFSTSGSRDLNNLFAQQVQQKMLQLDSSKGTVQQRLQDLIARHIEGTVLLKIKRTGKLGSGSALSFQDLLSNKSHSSTISSSDHTSDSNKESSQTSPRLKNRVKTSSSPQTQHTKTPSRKDQGGSLIDTHQSKPQLMHPKSGRTPKKRKV